MSDPTNSINDFSLWNYQVYMGNEDISHLVKSCSQIPEIDAYFDNMYCLDTSTKNLFIEYGSNRTNIFMYILKCNDETKPPGTVCKS
jgi:hypothetical protein